MSEPSPRCLGYRVYTSRITPLNPPDILGGNKKSCNPPDILAENKKSCSLTPHASPKGDAARTSRALPAQRSGSPIPRGGLGWGKTDAKNQVSKLFQTCVYTVAINWGGSQKPPF